MTQEQFLNRSLQNLEDPYLREKYYQFLKIRDDIFCSTCFLRIPSRQSLGQKVTRLIRLEGKLDLLSFDFNDSTELLRDSVCILRNSLIVSSLVPFCFDVILNCVVFFVEELPIILMLPISCFMDSSSVRSDLQRSMSLCLS